MILKTLLHQNKMIEVKLERSTEGEAGWEGTVGVVVGTDVVVVVVFLLRAGGQAGGHTGLVLVGPGAGGDAGGQRPGGAPATAGGLAGQRRLAGGSSCSS